MNTRKIASSKASIANKHFDIAYNISFIACEVIIKRKQLTLLDLVHEGIIG